MDGEKTKGAGKKSRIRHVLQAVEPLSKSIAVICNTHADAEEPRKVFTFRELFHSMCEFGKRKAYAASLVEDSFKLFARSVR